MDAAEYARRADVWPLNPEGELFAVAMIESQEAVNNIHEILQTPVSAIMVVPGDMAMDLGLGPNPSGEITLKSTLPSRPCLRPVRHRTA